MVGRPSLAALFGAALVLGAPRSASADEAEPIELGFEGSACGTAETFRSQVLLRTTRARFVESGARRAFRVTISGTPPRGRVVVVDARGQRSERDLGTAPCAELLEALALVTAIAIDPAASTKPIAELAPPPWLGYPREAPGPIAVTFAPPPVPTWDKPSAPPPRATWRAVVVAHAGVLAGPLPGPIATFGGGAGALREAGIFSQELRFAVSGGTTAEASSGGASARFSAVRLDLSLRPLHWATRWVTLAPVVAATVLHVDVTPTGVADPQAAGRWVALLALRGRVTLELRPVFLELELGPSFALVRERYYIDPNVTLHQAPWVAFDGTFGVGVRFP